jgi:SAM-dependent methyltransferase
MGLRERWNEVAADTAGTPAYWSLTATNAGMRRVMEPLLASLDPGLVLDTGAGALAFRQFITGRSGLHYLACDLAHTHPDLNFVADGTNLPVRTGAAQTVICSAVIEHVPDTQALLNELRRVLAPGGFLLMTVPHVHYIHAEPHDYYRFTEFGIRHVLERAGFDVVSVESVGGLTAHLSTLASSAWLGLCARPRLLRALALAANRILVSLCCALDRRLDRAGKYAMGYVVAAHPSRREHDS